MSWVAFVSTRDYLITSLAFWRLSAQPLKGRTGVRPLISFQSRTVSPLGQTQDDREAGEKDLCLHVL